MGYHFELEHANIVAFVTTPNTNRGYKEPVITEGELESFLKSLNSHNLLSSSKLWLNDLISTADTSLKKYQNIKIRKEEKDYYRDKINVFYDRSIDFSKFKEIDQKEKNEEEFELIKKRVHEKNIYVENKDLKYILDPIRYILSDFELFGLSIFGNDQFEDDELLNLATQYAQVELENALILIPNNNYQSDSYIEILSAAKPFSIFSNIDSSGMLFWDQKNNSKFIPLEQLRRLKSFSGDKLHNYIINLLKDKTESFSHITSTLPSILHLSDLHFGNKDVASNLNYLLSHIKNIKGIKHIVITGDLIENPDTSNCHLYNYFISELKSLDLSISVVAGNHDHKKDGWRKVQGYRNCDIKLSDKVDVNHNIKTIFFCIDSTVDGDTYFARGNVSREQLVEIGTKYENIKREYGNVIETYNKIALIHHHPFAFTYEDTTNYIKKAKFYMHDKTLELRNSDQIIEWCCDMNINLILHGHKHLQRYVECEIQNNGTAISKIDSIGCGTSTGTKGDHLSYNLISLNDNKTYNYSFFRGKNNAAGFYPEYLKIYKEKR
ncbi:metallophosphoesterase [Aliarcobacter cryaerophilus]|uniref:metallophosphoesterase family protein n=1 Tax=Aliarcobacter cryaerophilus TaxID=28198 RepID=UPI0021B5A6C9|nr:metallophosphoesterase [Aliarcobacter cryaerophilus]MCT7533291.1 metallophosphoesterase [Aliarcobacter cryaerophilus]